jgi:hypothetical protein
VALIIALRIATPIAIRSLVSSFRLANNIFFAIRVLGIREATLMLGKAGFAFYVVHARTINDLFVMGSQFAIEESSGDQYFDTTDNTELIQPGSIGRLKFWRRITLYVDRTETVGGKTFKIVKVRRVKTLPAETLRRELDGLHPNRLSSKVASTNPRGPIIIENGIRVPRDTAGTGGIKSISGRLNQDGSVTYTITGELKPPMVRRTAPNYNKQLPSARDIRLPDYEIAHLWGPGFGDEAWAGMSYAPRTINQELQNQRVEKRIRDLRDIAAKQEAKILVEATAVVSKWNGHDILNEAKYVITVELKDGSKLNIAQVEIYAPPIDGLGIPHGRPTVDVRRGSGSVWSF